VPGWDVRIVQQMGWAGVKNRELLRRAEGQFDLFLTCTILSSMKAIPNGRCRPSALGMNTRRDGVALICSGMDHPMQLDHLIRADGGVLGADGVASLG